MLQFLGWYFLVSITGLLVFPIVFRFLPKLHDKGYAFSRALGILLWGICFWMFSTFQILPNNLFGTLLALLIVFVISGLCLLKGNLKAILSWLKENVRQVITIELVFLVFFALWTFIRAANPDVANTEKPMELAFINAILRSPKFPPNDPWLSGYSISYYYLGYVLVAQIIRVTGVSAGVGYNLAGALWFALTALGAYGIVSNLIVGLKKDDGTQQKQKRFSVAGLLGSFFVLIVSNLEGLLESLHSSGLFWTASADGTLQSRFWTWLGIADLNQPPATPYTLTPSRWMWWWRASRVVGQSDLLGNSKEIIDEFPFFSYLLADLHPHVLAMPFVMLAIGITYNFYLTLRETDLSIFRFRDWIRKPEFWFSAIVLGSFGFLNTWNFPIYIAFFAAVFALARYQQLGKFMHRLWDFGKVFLLVILVGVILFLPFYVSFQSQAGGILPSLEFFTRNVHFWIMFAPLLIPIVIWLIWEIRNGLKNLNWKSGFLFSLVIIAGLFIVSWLFGWLLTSLSQWGTEMQTSGSSLLVNLSDKFVTAGTYFGYVHGLVPQSTLLLGSLLERIKAPGTVLSLGIVIFFVWGLLGRKTSQQDRVDFPKPSSETKGMSNSNQPKGFILLMVLLGAGLTLVPEFVYLKDQFGWPINTYFKFYFEAWIFWGLAAAVASYILFSKLEKVKLTLFSVGWAVLICASLIYPVFSVYSKTNGFKPDKFALDGLSYRQKNNADEEAAIEWLKSAPYGIIVEAVGGEYSEYARVSTESGLPSVLGWPGHEIQWRGGTAEIGSRETDIQTIYQSNDWTEIELMLRQYHVRYVFLGMLERIKYAPEETQANDLIKRFSTHLPIVFQNLTVTIYEYQNDGNSTVP